MEHGERVGVKFSGKRNVMARTGGTHEKDDRYDLLPYRYLFKPKQGPLLG